MRRALFGMCMFVGFVGMIWVSASVAQDQDVDYSTDADASFQGNDTPNRVGRPDRDRTPVPQLDYECFPIEVGFNQEDLLLTCSEPLVVGNEVINVFSVRHNIRYAAVAAAIITTAAAHDQALLITVDATIPSHGRCRDNCRRINQAVMVTSNNTQ